MKILLTGATGYLGSHLARAFVDAGHKVAVLKRQNSDLQRLVGIQAELACYDLELGGMSEAFHDTRYDVVVHTATCYGRAGELPGELFAANTAWPLQLLESAVVNRTPLFINADTSLERSLNPYALSKKQFRDWGVYLAGEKAICFQNLLLEHFYGPGDMDSKFVTQVIRRCLRDEPEMLLTEGIQRRDFIYITDVVKAFLLLMQNAAEVEPRFMEYGLGSGDAVPIRELVTMIKALTRSTTFLKFGSIPLRNNEVMISEADISELQLLGWRPKVSLADGLAQTIKIEKEIMKRTTL